MTYYVGCITSVQVVVMGKQLMSVIWISLDLFPVVKMQTWIEMVISD